MGIAVRKGDTELREALEKAVQTLKDNGTLSEISEKWFGTDMTKNKKWTDKADNRFIRLYF